MTDRNGPLVTDDTGLPMRRRYYQDLYRDVADALACHGPFGICSLAMAASLRPTILALI